MKSSFITSRPGHQIKLELNITFLTPIIEMHGRHNNVRMKIVIKTILQQIVAHCAGTQDDHHVAHVEEKVVIRCCVYIAFKYKC